MHKMVKSKHRRKTPRVPVGCTSMSKSTKEALRRQFEKESSVSKPPLSEEIKVTWIYTLASVLIGLLCWFYWS